MKVAIISDLHDNAIYLERFLAWAGTNKIYHLIACGDLANQDTLDRVIAGFGGKIHLAIGNADSFNQNKEYEERISILPREGGIVRIEELNIGLCHEPKYIKALEASQPDFIFYGHTHKPHLEKINLSIVANPGTLGGWHYPSTFALLETENGELKLIISEEEKI